MQVQLWDTYPKTGADDEWVHNLLLLEIYYS